MSGRSLPLSLPLLWRFHQNSQQFVSPSLSLSIYPSASSSPHAFSFLHTVVDACSQAGAGAARILFQHRRNDCQLATSVSPGARRQETPSFMAGDSNLLCRRGAERTFSLRVSPPACVGGGVEITTAGELKFNLHDLQSLRTFSLHSHHLSKRRSKE